jgi:phage gpG-like protein
MSISSQGVTFITNANELSAKFGRMAQKIDDPKPVLEACKRILNEQEQQVWATEGGALGVTWGALVQPQRKTEGGGLLVGETGQLRSSMEEGTIRGATLRITSRRKAFYGFFHQFGTGTMDARPFSGISDASMRLILSEFENATGRSMGI